MDNDVIRFSALGRELEIRAANIHDAAELALCELSCFPSDPWSPEMFVEAVENPACGVYILNDMQMSKTLGYSVMYFAADEADLANIAVMPEIRGHGFGRTLLTETLTIAREKGVSRVFLEVRESNECARELYKSSAFAEIGKRRKYYKNPREDAVVMMKTI